MELIFDEETTSQAGPGLKFDGPELRFDQRYQIVPTQTTTPVVTDPLDRYEGQTLTRDIILGDDELFNKYIREPLSARFGVDNRNRWLLDAELDTEMSKEDMFEYWQNYQRSFAGGQTLTTAAEVTFLQSASEEEKALVGRSYVLFDRMPNIFSEDTSWGEMFDGMGDYVRAAVIDPTTVLGLGVGRAVGALGTKGAATAIRTAAAQAAQAAIARGATQEAAELAGKQVARRAMLTNFAKNSAVLAGIDLPAAIGADLGYQYSMMDTGVQDEYSPGQTAIAALGTIALPAVAAGFRGVRALSQTKGADRLGMGRYVDIKQKLAGQTSHEAITKTVIDNTDMDAIEQGLGTLVRDIMENPQVYGDWVKGKSSGADVTDQALGGVIDIGDGDMSLFNALTKGDSTRGIKGIYEVLADAGYVHVPRYPGEPKSNLMGDIIGSVRPDILEGVFKDTKYENFTPTELGAYYKKRASALGTGLQALDFARRGPTYGDLAGALAGRADDGTHKERLLYVQSTWKRLVTSHPGTTGLNVKGWTFTTALNSVSDMVEAVLSGGPLTKNGRASMLGAIRRGYNVLNWMDTADAAKEFFEVQPEVGAKLHRYITAGVDQGDALKLYNLDPDSNWNKSVEKTVNFMQTVSGQKIQDELTKQISFMSSLDQEIMRKYGYGYNKFMDRPDAYVTMYSPEFQEVMETALDRALRETYSKPYSHNSSGKGLVRHFAREIERLSNTPGIGMLIPFGQFLNNSINTVADYTGINLAYHWSKRLYGSNIDFAEERSLQLMAKTAVGIGLAVSYFAPKELEKMEEGLRWNEEPVYAGGILDTTFDAPYPYFSMFGRILAHKQRDGEVPPELIDEAWNLFIGQTTRELGVAGQEATEFGKQLLGLALEDIGGASVAALGAITSQVVSGFTRPLDPINQFALAVADSFEPLDRRQGIRAWNESIRYVDAVLPSTSEEIRRNPTNTIPAQDLGRVLGGNRQAQTPSVANRMLAAVGRSPWNAMKWEGDYPQLKNRLDALVEPIINQNAQDAIARTDFFNQSLQRKEQIVSDVLSRSREQAKEILSQGSDRDKMLNRLSTIYGYSQRERGRAMAALGIDDMKIEDIATMSDGMRKLELIIWHLQNSGSSR